VKRDVHFVFSDLLDRVGELDPATIDLEALSR
jgi:hypothetical protein